MLIMSNNFVQLFFGWEAVGLVSYLLIGFYFKRPSAIFANLKAFFDQPRRRLRLFFGIGLVLAYFGGSLRYQDVFAYLPNVQNATIQLFPGVEWSLITVTCLLLFVGAMGKSAQFPLHVWLPDSMEGPTPISALIHAATMVTAGLFMVSRMSPIYEMSSTALSVIMVIGAITALFMGFLGVIQNDIKRVVAYSTLSQLGYMTVALGASAYSVAMFHVMTHAFFKALLFLAAGSAIIGMHHDQDMRHMGNLKKYMPITWLTMLIGNLSLIGTPFFSGFYPKIRLSKQRNTAPCRAAALLILPSLSACLLLRSMRSANTLWCSTAKKNGAACLSIMMIIMAKSITAWAKRQSARKPVGCYPAFDSAGHSVRYHRLRCH